MNIDINKDFEREYKDDFLLGFSVKEVVGITVAACMILGAGILLWKLTKFPPDICVYLAVPCGIPSLAITFYRYQELSVLQIIREYFYYKKTQELTFDAGQWKYDDMKTFTMQLERLSKKKYYWRRRKQRKGGKH